MVNGLVDAFFVSVLCVIALILLGLEVWPESHWPGFALRQTDVL